MHDASAFSSDYSTARLRFLQAATSLGWMIESYAIGQLGPNSEELTIDVAMSSHSNSEQTFVTSSGVHGVEGFFGSAVQLALLERWALHGAPQVRCVFLHGLNPYGFAWLRRFDEHNVDPNRNFRLTGEPYQGAPPRYAELDHFLNPPRPPSRWESFFIKALPVIARHGMSVLQQTVAAGQYEFSKGLFYGGREPTQMFHILRQHLRRWLKGSRDVVHLDFHTGLGRSGTCQLLIDYPLSPSARRNLTDWFGAASYQACDSNGISYDAHGGFGRWCVNEGFASEYLFACAEFGTFGPVTMLAGLRAENQAHHWGESDSSSTRRAKTRLKELFCPGHKGWRLRALRESIKLADQAIAGLVSLR